MKNNNQAALDLFSNYSAFMLTDDELLVIHGGATPTGGTSAGTPNAPAAAPPQAPPAPPAISPVNVTITYDYTPVAKEYADAVVNSQMVHAADTFGAHIIQAVDNFFFGPSSPQPSTGGSGGGGGAEGSTGTGG